MRRILVADDEEALRFLLHVTLEEGEYEIVDACDGREALTAARTFHPSLVILDWMMPKMEGIEVVRALKRDPATRHIPVILLTSRSQEADRLEGRDAGVSVFLAKPFSPKELVWHVERLLGS